MRDIIKIINEPKIDGTMIKLCKNEVLLYEDKEAENGNRRFIVPSDMIIDLNDPSFKINELLEFLISEGAILELDKPPAKEYLENIDTLTKDIRECTVFDEDDEE